jgi:hypothetical protein
VFHAGNGGDLWPKNLDGKGAFELVGDDDGWAYTLAGLGFAENPLSPVVFGKQGGKYVRQTRRFRHYLQDKRREIVSRILECHKKVITCYESIDGNAVVGLSVLLGDWPVQRKTLAVDADERDRLDQLSRKIAGELGKEHVIAF